MRAPRLWCNKNNCCRAIGTIRFRYRFVRSGPERSAMRLAKVLIAAFSSIVLIGCPPNAENNRAGGNTGEILIGEYGSLTGSEATFGQETHNAIMVAIDEINAAGGVNGRRLRVFTEDTQSKAEEAPTAVTKLITQNNVVAVLGEVASSSSIAAAPVCQTNRIPMISPSSTNRAVTEKG